MIFKIGIDARLYGPKNGGIGRYLNNLIAQLEKVDLESQYVVFLRKENYDDYRPQNPNFKKVLADFRPYSFREQVLMPLAVRRQKASLMHFPHFNVPLLFRGKFVVTIHDLIPFRFSGRETSNLSPFLFAIKRAFLVKVFSSAVKRAAKIIAVSNYTKDDIVKYFKISPEKIIVTYEGSPAIKINHKSEISNLKFANGPYLLYVGSAYPHKNLERLVRAFKNLKSEISNLKLVLAGKEDSFYRKLRQKAREMGLEKVMVFTGYVSDEELAKLYENAALYVFPSLAEGFGLPPLEAMSHGLPVVSSDATCLPEILGKAAEYFDPRDSRDMAEKIRKVLESEERRKELRERGFERISEFSWQKCAAETLSAYRRATADSR